MTSFSNTYRRMGLDNKVWLVMLIVSILSLGVLGYNTAVVEPCIPPNIAINSSNMDVHNRFVTNEIVTFSISNITRKNRQVVWSFGDGSQTNGLHVTHNYANEGRFTVTATVNGKCEETKVVHVVKGSFFDPNVTTHPKLPNDIITGNFSPLTNQQTLYKCIAYAGSYEWQILNSKDFPVKTGKEISFNFRNSGNYTLQLKLDNDRSKIFTKTIYVAATESNKTKGQVVPLVLNGLRKKTTPTMDSANDVKLNPSIPVTPLTPETVKPVPNENESPRTPTLTADRNFLKLLQGVVNGSKDVKDFDDYLCDKGNTEVVINEKDHTTLNDFCKSIKGNDRRRVDAVEVIRGDRSCVRRLNVIAKKKRLMMWVNL